MPHPSVRPLSLALLALLAAPPVATVSAQQVQSGAPPSAGAPARAKLSWRANAPPDYAVALDSAVRHGGGVSVHLRGTGAEPEGFAGVMQLVRADAYRGRRLRFSGWLRSAAIDGSGASLWMRVDGPGRMLDFANLGQRTVRGTTDWTRVDIAVDVPDSAIGISFGVLLAGSGDVWADDLAFEGAGALAGVTPPPMPPRSDAEETRRMYAGEPTAPAALDFEHTTLDVRAPARAPAAREPSRAFAGRGLENVTALARLYGYVRYFYPSNEGRAADWDSLLVAGVRRVEGAPDADSLARMLQAIVAPVAPAVQLFAAAHPVGARATVAPRDAACVLHWVHHGVGTGDATLYRGGGGPYRSERVCTALTADGRAPDGVPDPRAPLEVALGAGVVARVPIALYGSVRDTATLREATAAPPMRFSAADRATRLAAIAEVWNVMQHFYPYFDVVRTDWSAELPRALAAAATDAGPSAFGLTLGRLLAALHDGHANAYRTDGTDAARYYAPPLTLDWVEQRLVVTQVADSGAGGIRRGDVVVAIDGRPAEAALAEREGTISGATSQWVRHLGVRSVLAGVSGTPVTLRVRPVAGGADRDVTLARTAGMGQVRETRPATVAELRPGVYYLDLDRLTDAQFDSILPSLERARGIVFDMRGYPNGLSTPRILAHLSDSTIRSARFEVPVYTRPDREGVTYAAGGWPVPPAAPRLRAKVAFVTGGGAISYAETTMGIVEAYRLGEVVGEPTAGTNGNVNPFVVPGGYRVSWTGMRVRKHDGSRHHGVGILPTVPVHRTLKGVAEGRDELLDRAVVIVSTVP